LGYIFVHLALIQEDMRWFFKKIFRLWGWKKEGHIPNEIPKKIYVVIPHTSNYDFPVGILLKFAYKMEVGFIAKASLFKWPIAWIFKGLGGIPVDRKKTTGFIDAVVDKINTSEKFCTAIAPEGKRDKVNKLKKGYYYIAKGANIPIVYVKFDWKNKITAFDKPHMPAETVEEELEYAREYFKDTQGYHPEKSFGYPFNQ
jgi:1-acyl-sn-glycerol-3-phosphate acyltransferase